jgi:hypothetical protein
MNGEDDHKNVAVTPSTDRKVVESQLVGRFFQALERTKERLQSKGDFRLSDQEQKVLMDICSHNLMEGSVAGIVTFVALRRIRMMTYNYIRRRAPNEKQPITPNAFNSPFQQQRPPEEQKLLMERGVPDPTGFGSRSWLFNPLTIFLDGMIAFYVTVFVSGRNTDHFMQQVAELPLAEGRSQVADELCPVLVLELQRMYTEQKQQQQQQLLPSWNSMEQQVLEDPQSATLKFFIDFCSNCRRRAAYEEILRREQLCDDDDDDVGNDWEQASTTTTSNNSNRNDIDVPGTKSSSASSSIAIPSPGVPRDIVYPDLSEWMNGRPRDRQDDVVVDANGGANHTTDWAEAFVSDQELDPDDDQRDQRDQRQNGSRKR